MTEKSYVRMLVAFVVGVGMTMLVRLRPTEKVCVPICAQATARRSEIQRQLAIFQAQSQQWEAAARAGRPEAATLAHTKEQTRQHLRELARQDPDLASLLTH